MTDALSAWISDAECDLRDRVTLADLRDQLSELLALCPIAPMATITARRCQRMIAEIEGDLWWRQQMRDQLEAADVASDPASDAIVLGQGIKPATIRIGPFPAHPGGFDAWIEMVDGGVRLVYRDPAARNAYLARR